MPIEPEVKKSQGRTVHDRYDRTRRCQPLQLEQGLARSEKTDSGLARLIQAVDFFDSGVTAAIKLQAGSRSEETMLRQRQESKSVAALGPA